MILTLNPVCVDGSDLYDWLVRSVPIEVNVAIVERPGFDCHGASKMFASVDVDEPLTLQELLDRKTVNGSAVQFFMDDVVAAAVGAGELVGNFFWVYLTW